MFRYVAALISSDYLPQNDASSIADITAILFAIFGAIAVLMVVWSGVQLILSQGNSEKVAQARRGIIYAIVGLLVIISAQLIVSFVFKEIDS